MALAAAQPENDLVLEITRIFKAPRDRVFAAWTTPEHLGSWWGPKGHGIPEHDFDVREGGAWRAVLRSPKGTDHIVSGVFKEISAPERVVFSWGWTIDGVRSHESIVTVQFDEVRAGTKVHLHQASLTSKADRDGHGLGWGGTFDNLDDFLAGMPREIKEAETPS